MIEKEIERYFNERLATYKDSIYQELVNVFGSYYSVYIMGALNTPIAYQVEKDYIDFYEKIYNTLSSEEQQLIDYFKDKLEEDDTYILGSTSGVITSFMKEYKDYLLVDKREERLINTSIIMDPNKIYTLDEMYIYNLCMIISLRIINLDDVLMKQIEIRRVICKSLGMEIAKRLHLKGIYLFDSQSVIDEYQPMHDEFNKQVVMDKNFPMDKNLLNSLNSVLPLCFSDYQLFLSKVGKDNFENFISAYNSNDGDMVYESVRLMRESLSKNDSSEIIMVDTRTILNAVKSMNEKKQKTSSETKKEEKTEIKPSRPMISSKRILSLLEGLDLKLLFDKLNNDKYKIDNNINIVDIDTHKYGTDILCIDEDGKDTLDPPSGPKR